MPPHVFVSYSRVDRKVTERLVARLRRVYEHDDVWFDDDLVGGDKWWKAILAAIADCDVFLFLLSNESVTSPYCLAEFKEAQRLQKPIVTVQVRDRTNVTRDLSEIQYVNMGSGMTEDAFDDLLRAIRRQAALPKNRRPLWMPATSLPKLPTDENEVSAATPVRETPDLRVESPKTPVNGGLMRYVPAVLALVVLIGALALIVPPILSSMNVTQTPTTQAAIIPSHTLTDPPTEPSATHTPITQPSPTLTPTDSPSDTPIPTLATTTDPLEVALEQARTFAGTQNTDWQPFVYTFPDDPAAVPMVLVPVGAFQMGSNDGAEDEQPVHTQIFTELFWIDRTEVTRAQYALCVRAGACTTVPDSQYATRDTQPINRVTWFQAYDYCAWRGADYRLPQEREWEYTARGLEAWIYPWGNDDPTSSLAVYGGLSETADVGSKSPVGDSWVGAQDLSGNVWEWVNSLYLPYQSVYNPEDGREASPEENSTDMRVLRGSSFGDFANGVRGADRNWFVPTNVNVNIGFRCARSSIF